MLKHNFDLCKAECQECNGINIENFRVKGYYKCLNTGKILKQEDSTTLVENFYKCAICSYHIKNMRNSFVCGLCMEGEL